MHRAPSFFFYLRAPPTTDVFFTTTAAAAVVGWIWGYDEDEGMRGSGKMKEFTRGGSFLDLGELEELQGILLGVICHKLMSLAFY
jgi:hypothetical protein